MYRKEEWTGSRTYRSGEEEDMQWWTDSVGIKGSNADCCP
jgi:hypothetical protein